MTVAYFDCYAGVAGDMILGAMIDAGLPLPHLKRELAKLSLGGYRIGAVKSKGEVIAGTNFKVEIKGQLNLYGSIRHYKDIVSLVNLSRLKREVKNLSLKIFDCLASAEAKVHRCKKDSVHFHELGAVDSIVDIVGAAVGFEYFGFDSVCSSPLPVTRGFVKCQHGRLPVPTPATLEIIKGVPLEPQAVKGEIVTPTGAAILKTVVGHFGGNPVRTVKKIGYGYGDTKFKGLSNTLRLIIGEGHPLEVIEANIDDMNPKYYDYVIDKLIASGAIDVTLGQVWMKKRRPGVLLKILCESLRKKRVIDIILKETTTLGVRYYPVERETLDREDLKVRVAGSVVRVKIGKKGMSVYNIEPEYNDCKKVAVQKGIPLKQVFQEAIIRACRQLGGGCNAGFSAATASDFAKKRST